MTKIAGSFALRSMVALSMVASSYPVQAAPPYQGVEIMQQSVSTLAKAKTFSEVIRIARKNIEVDSTPTAEQVGQWLTVIEKKAPSDTPVSISKQSADAWTLRVGRTMVRFQTYGFDERGNPVLSVNSHTVVVNMAGTPEEALSNIEAAFPKSAGVLNWRLLVPSLFMEASPADAVPLVVLGLGAAALGSLGVYAYGLYKKGSDQTLCRSVDDNLKKCEDIAEQKEDPGSNFVLANMQVPEDNFVQLVHAKVERCVDNQKKLKHCVVDRLKIDLNGPRKPMRQRIMENKTAT